MKEIDVNSWEKFEEQIADIFCEREKLREESGLYISKPLFRGQANFEWNLTTTLERYKEEEFSLSDYYRKISASQPQIETFTGKSWDILSYPEYLKWIENVDMFEIPKYPGYEYIIYLRHHGFPSPLLDWTRSPYIAAFFAFNAIDKNVSKVSIYAFIEHYGKGKSSGSDKPYILSLGPYVKSHERHFLQQSQYTVCLKATGISYNYACHEDVFKENNEDQDLLWKFNIPAEERLKVLKKLDKVNVTSFSLFGTEESLMDTLALREIYLKE